MLTDVLHITRPTTDELSPEDIFASSAALLFPDDTRNSHGDLGSTITYTSPFGPVPLTVAYDPHGKDVKLFAHYLWNAGVWLAEAMAGSERDEVGLRGNERGRWGVEGEGVLEVGAGAWSRAARGLGRRG